MTKLIKKYQPGGAVTSGSNGFSSTLNGILNSADTWLGSADSGKVWSNVGSAGSLIGAVTGDQNIGKITSNVANLGQAASTLAKGATFSKNFANGVQGFKNAFNGVKMGDAAIKGKGLINGFKNIKAISDAAKFNGGMANIAGSMTNVANLGSTALGAINSLTSLDKKREYQGDKGAITQGLDMAWDLGASAASFAGPVGAAVGLGMNALKTVGNVANKLGAGTDAMTTQDAILGSSLFNWNLGMINGALGKTVDKSFTIDEDVMNNTGSGYQNFAAYAPEANKASGKKYGLLSRGARKRGEAAIDYANAAQNVLTDISEEGERAKAAADYYGIGYANDWLLRGGVPNTLVAKQGSKLNLKKDRLNRAKSIVKTLQVAPTQVVTEMPSIDGFSIEHLDDFKLDMSHLDDIAKAVPPTGMYRSGGKLGDTNVIPEGALHAHLNKMEGADEDFTKKGIPVITEEGGKIEQHAEIERNEIIFRKEVTEKLEKLMKEGTDEAALEAGKLLVHEILFNTEDNTGLIKEINDEEN